MAGSLFPLFALRGGDSADFFRTTTRNGVGRLMATGGLQKRMNAYRAIWREPHPVPSPHSRREARIDVDAEDMVAGRAFRKRNRPLPESAMKRRGWLCGGTNWLKFSSVTDTTEHGKRKAHKYDGRASVRDMVLALAATIPR
jgi:hypothetical protein